MDYSIFKINYNLSIGSRGYFLLKEIQTSLRKTCQQIKIKNNSFALSVFLTVFLIGMIFMFVWNDEYIIIIAILEGVTKLSLIVAWMISFITQTCMCNNAPLYHTFVKLNWRLQRYTCFSYF